MQAPSIPTDLIALPTNAPAPPTNLVAFLNPPRTGPGSLVASLLPPVAGPTSLTTLALNPPVAGPANLTSVMLAPAAGPTNLSAGLPAPNAGPTGLTASEDFLWTQTDAFDERNSLLALNTTFTSTGFIINTGEYVCGLSISNIVPATTQAGLANTGDGSSTNPNMTAWYPGSTTSDRATSLNDGLGQDKDAVWTGFNYLGTRNLDDFDQTNRQWVSTSGTQHAWSFDKQWGSGSGAGGRTYWLLFDPTQGRYCVLSAAWRDVVGGAAQNNGFYSSFRILDKLDHFNNAMDANNPYGSYTTLDFNRYSVYVGNGAVDNTLPQQTGGVVAFNLKYTIPNSTVQGVEIQGRDNTLLSTF